MVNLERVSVLGSLATSIEVERCAQHSVDHVTDGADRCGVLDEVHDDLVRANLKVFARHDYLRLLVHKVVLLSHVNVEDLVVEARHGDHSLVNGALLTAAECVLVGEDVVLADTEPGVNLILVGLVVRDCTIGVLDTSQCDLHACACLSHEQRGSRCKKRSCPR